MKAYKYLSIGLVLCSLALAGLNGTYFSNDQFEVRAPGDWQADTARRGKAIAFIRNDGVTEVSVEVMPLEGKQRDAFDVAKDQNIAYDGWQYLAGRYLEWNEKHNADNGFCAMYHKNLLRRISTNTKIIVQEYYFVKGRTAYILTLLTDTERWEETKDQLLSVLYSFNIK